MTLLGSCSKQNEDIPDPNPENILYPIELTKAEQEIAQASNAFGFDLYRALYKDDSMLLSPLSISLALSMTACGAEGNTADQMCAVLGFDGHTTEEVAGFYKKMTKDLVTVDKNTTFEVANSIWLEKVAFKVKKSFLDLTGKYFNSEVRNVSFSDGSTLDEINGWCSDKTHGKIEKALDRLNPDTRVMLINAVYFNGQWASDMKFNTESRKVDFHCIDGSEAQTWMMKRQGKMAYACQDGWEEVKIPYGNEAFYMSVILPPAERPFKDAAARFDEDLCNRLDRSSDMAQVILRMPKFTFDYSTDGLCDALRGLGMEDAFKLDAADFSGISDTPLFIEDIIHKTYIDVNPKGTEAAAITIIDMPSKIEELPEEEPVIIEFNADRPFLFLIREVSTGSVIFMGQKVK